MTPLIDLVRDLASLDRDATIYAAEPWTCDSPAIVQLERASDELPEEAMRHGLKYFLEVFVAKDFLDDWQSTFKTPPTAEAQCDRLIRYAADDA